MTRRPAPCAPHRRDVAAGRPVQLERVDLLGGDGAPRRWLQDTLAAYEAERRPATTATVLASRRGAPERVIDLVEARAPAGFDDLEAVAPYAEREAIVRAYASLAGHAKDQVNRR